MNIKLLIAIAIALSFLLTGCEIEAPAPQKLDKNTGFHLEESVISIPISIKSSEIQDIFQRAIDENSSGDQLFFESGRDIGSNATLQTIVKKRDSVSVYAKDNYIEAHLPLHVDLRVDWSYPIRVDLKIMRTTKYVKTHKDSSVQFTVIAKWKPKLGEDYKLDPNIDLSYHLDRPAQIKVGPFEINLVSKTREAISKQIDKFKSKLNDSLREKLHTKRYVQKAWEMAQKPVLVSEDDNVWLVSDLTSLHAMPLYTSNDTVHFGVGIKGKFSLQIGAPEEDVKIREIPPLDLTLPSTGFSLNVPVLASYSELQKQATMRLRDQEINYEGNRLSVKEVIIYGALDGKLVVGANMDLTSSGEWFGTEGWVYLLGTPAYDKAKKVMSINDISYDVNSNSILLDVAAWAASPFIKGEIEKALTFELSDMISDTKSATSEKMKEIIIDGIGKISGELKEFEIDSFVVQSNAIQLVAKASGNIQMEISDYEKK